MAQLRGLPLQDEGSGGDSRSSDARRARSLSAYDAAISRWRSQLACRWRRSTRSWPPRRGRRRRRARPAGERAMSEALAAPVATTAPPPIPKPAGRCNSTRSPPSCRSIGATGSPRFLPTTTSRRSNTWRAKGWAKIRCARSPRTWPISKPGRRRRRARPCLWPAPEGLALKFVAHHLWDPAQREVDAAHGMPAEIAAALTAAGALRVDGPHAPSTVKRRLASWGALHRWRGLDGPFASPALRVRGAACRARQRAAAPAQEFSRRHPRHPRSAPRDLPLRPARRLPRRRAAADRLRLGRAPAQRNRATARRAVFRRGAGRPRPRRSQFRRACPACELRCCAPKPPRPTTTPRSCWSDRPSTPCASGSSAPTSPRARFSVPSTNGRAWSSAP